jgi:xylulokinase
MKYVLGCDLGSQGVKVILVTAEGRLVGEASVSYGIDYPIPTWAEQSTSLWTEAICGAVRKVLSTTCVPAEQIVSLGLDAQVDGVVPIDTSGKPLRSAIIWMDRRAVAQCDAVAKRFDPQKIFQITGLNLDASHGAPKIRWLAENEPEIYRKAVHFLLPGSYIVYYLTGELAVDYSNASSTMLMDMRKKTWSPEMCACFDISPDSLAPIYPAPTDVGHLRREVAEKMGLKPTTRVILGSGDEHAACLGAGVVRPGLACDIAGTAEPVCAVSPEILIDASGLVETHCHADPDVWLLENPGFISGANYRWFRDQFGAQEIEQAAKKGVDPYMLLDQGAASVPPGSEGLIMLPCLMGAMTPTWNALARGTFMGFTLAHRREHFCRAVLEASAYAVRDITDQMQKMGLKLEEIRVVGGGARSSLWRQIKADVIGLPISITQTSETTSLGAAILGLVGSGIVETLAQAIQATVQVVETRQPEPEVQARYEDYYQLYRSTYFSLLPTFELAAKRGL